MHWKLNGKSLDFLLQCLDLCLEAFLGEFFFKVLQCGPLGGLIDFNGKFKACQTKFCLNNKKQN